MMVSASPKINTKKQRQHPNKTYWFLIRVILDNIYYTLTNAHPTKVQDSILVCVYKQYWNTVWILMKSAGFSVGSTLFSKQDKSGFRMTRANPL